MDRPTITVKQAADILGVVERTVSWAYANGKIEGVKRKDGPRGHGWMVHLYFDSVAAYKRRRRTNSELWYAVNKGVAPKERRKAAIHAQLHLGLTAKPPKPKPARPKVAMASKAPISREQFVHGFASLISRLKKTL